MTTEQATYTPGPWGTIRESDSNVISVTTPEGWPLADVGGDNEEQALANALLIASAPDLIEALQDMLPWLEYSGPPHPGHICGPESACDLSCAEYAEWAMALHRIRAASAKALLRAPLNRVKLAEAPLPYEKLDQLTMEVLMGVR